MSKGHYKYYILDMLGCFQFIAQLVFEYVLSLMPVVNCPISRRGISDSRDTIHRMRLFPLPVPVPVR